MKYLYACYGRAGLECLRLLQEKIKSNDNLIIFTYQTNENDELIKYLDDNKLNYYFGSLSEKKNFQIVQDFHPDHIISIHYRDLIPEKILKCSKNKGMNLHPSLLPKYAGCLATMWAIINGEDRTGITYHFLTNKFDDGNIILQEPIQIAPNETGESLFNKAIDTGVQHFLKALELLESRYEGIPQEGERTYNSRAIPFKGQINQDWKDQEVERFIRAFTFANKQPAFVSIENKKFYIHSFVEYKKLKECN